MDALTKVFEEILQSKIESNVPISREKSNLFECSDSRKTYASNQCGYRTALERVRPLGRRR